MVEGCTIQDAITVINLQYLKEKTAFIYRADGPHLSRGASTSALDPELRHEVLKVMQDLAEEGMTMVIVTHEIGFAEKVASRLIFIDKGRIAEDGSPQALIENPPSPRLQEFLQHVS